MDRALGIISLICWAGTFISMVVGIVLNYRTARHLKRDSFMELIGFPLAYFLLKDEAESTEDSSLSVMFAKYRNVTRIFWFCVLGFAACWIGSFVLMVVS